MTEPAAPRFARDKERRLNALDYATVKLGGRPTRSLAYLAACLLGTASVLLPLRLAPRVSGHLPGTDRYTTTAAYTGIACVALAYVGVLRLLRSRRGTPARTAALAGLLTATLGVLAWLGLAIELIGFLVRDLRAR